MPESSTSRALAVFTTSGLFEPADVTAVGETIRLTASHCAACDRWEFPVRPYCPTCSATPEIAPLSSMATVRHVTAILHAPPGSLVAAPYVVAMASFPEGLDIFGVVPDASLTDIAAGDAIETVSAKLGAAYSYAFRAWTVGSADG